MSDTASGRVAPIIIKQKGSDAVVIGGSSPSTEMPQDQTGSLKRRLPDAVESESPAPRRRRTEGGGAAAATAATPPTTPATSSLPMKDRFCWACHKEDVKVHCRVCPRSFHPKCAGVGNSLIIPDWVCPECEIIVRAEQIDVRTPAMKMVTIDSMCDMLRYALKRMKSVEGSSDFQKPVPLDMFPDYSSYVCNPIDLGMLERNIKKKIYGSPESFFADAKWILHNCIIYNGTHNSLANAAKAMNKVCKQELSEIEVCPFCYTHAHTLDNDHWFVEPCKLPHLLIWAKLKGFPYWPAKAMRIQNNNVDVRFFGAHDKAWVPVGSCFLLSRDPPNPVKNKRNMFESSMDELNRHIKRLAEKFQSFQYSKQGVPLDPNKMLEQLQLMLPEAKLEKIKVAGTLPTTSRRRSKSQTRTTAEQTPPPATPSRLRSRSRSRTRGRTAPTTPKSPVKPPDERPQTPKTTRTSKSVVGTPARQTSTEILSGSPVISSMALALTKKEPESKETVNESGASISEQDPLHMKIIIKKLDINRAMEHVRQDKESIPQGLARSGTSTASEDSSDDSSDARSHETERGSRLSRLKKRASTSYADDTGDEAAIPTVMAALGLKSVDLEKPTLPIPRAAKTVERDTVLTMENTMAKSGIVPISAEAIGRGSRGKVHSALDTGNEYMDSSNCGLSQENLDICEEITIDDKEIVGGDATDGLEDGGEVIEIPQSDSDKIVTGKHGSQEVVDITQDSSSSESRGDSPIIISETQDTSAYLMSHDGQAMDLSLENEVKAKSVIVKPRLDSTAGGDAELMKPGPRKPPKLANKATRGGTQGLVMPTSEGGMVTKSAVRSVISGAASVMPASSTSDRNSPVPGTPPAAAILQGLTSSRSLEQPVSASDSLTTGSMLPNLSGAIPTNILNDLSEKYRLKTSEVVSSLMSDMIQDLARVGHAEATISNLHQQLDRLIWKHKQEMDEMKHNQELVLLELRQSMESEKQRALTELRRQLDIEKEAAVKATKKKQWCAACEKEALFYCCWNTSYCDYPCQQSHWPKHMNSCTQGLSVTIHNPESMGLIARNPNVSRALTASSVVTATPTTFVPSHPTNFVVTQGPVVNNTSPRYAAPYLPSSTNISQVLPVRTALPSSQIHVQYVGNAGLNVGGAASQQPPAPATTPSSVPGVSISPDSTMNKGGAPVTQASTTPSPRGTPSVVVRPPHIRPPSPYMHKIMKF